MCMPNSGSTSAGSLLPCTLFTRDQSASSSSARIMGSEVCTPWPKSSRLMVMVVPPSAAMCRNAEGCCVGLRPAGLAASWARVPSGKAPRAKPLRAPSFRKLRRGRPVWVGVLPACSRCIRACRWRGSSKVAWSKFMGCSFRGSGQGLGGVGDGGADARIGAAAADVARHGRVDLGLAGHLAARQGLEEGGGRHDLPALAVAALGHVVLHPGLVHGLAHLVAAAGDGFDGGDLL